MTELLIRLIKDGDPVDFIENDILIALEQCQICGKYLIWDNLWQGFNAHHLHRWQVNNDITPHKSGVEEPVCSECWDGKRYGLPCAICGTVARGNDIIVSYDGAECMCSKCYEILPAKLWREKEDELDEKYADRYGW